MTAAVRIFIFFGLSGKLVYGIWYMGIPVKDPAIQKSEITNHKPDILPTAALYTFGLTIWHMNGLRYNRVILGMPVCYPK